MKKSCLLLIAIFFTINFSYAQWAINGNNIYNNNSGNVGIGTANPQFNLEINAAVPYLKLSSSVYTVDPTILTVKGGIIFNQQDIDKTAAILEAVPPNYHVPGILFATKTAWNIPGPGSTDWYYRMFIHPNGNIGIGTTSPLTQVHIQGTGGAGSNLSILTLTNNIAGAAGNTASMDFNPTNDLGSVYGRLGSIMEGSSKAGLYFSTYNPSSGFGERLRIDGSGNVGVGTTSPLYKVDVTGSGRFTTGAYVNDGQAFGVVSGIGAAWANNTLIYKGYNPSIGGDYAEVLVPSGLVNSANIRLLVNGNVLIGQTSQQNSAYKLDVAGNVRANGIVVNTTGADFVFAPTYRLASLSKLKKYIDQHHHLPEIPAARQMQAEGLNVGDNQVKLLQKVEELTLYLINKDQTIARQQEQIDLLKHQVKLIQKKLK